MASWNVARLNGYLTVRHNTKVQNLEDGVTQYCNTTPILIGDLDATLDWCSKEAKIGDLIYLDGCLLGAKLQESMMNN